MEGEQAQTWKETVVAYFNVCRLQLEHLAGKTKENHEKSLFA
jgi:hypothetical protein